jgi:hypothetical protein
MDSRRILDHSGLSLRAIAQKAGTSERTVRRFRDTPEKVKLGHAEAIVTAAGGTIALKPKSARAALLEERLERRLERLKTSGLSRKAEDIVWTGPFPGPLALLENFVCRPEDTRTALRRHTDPITTAEILAWLESDPRSEAEELARAQEAEARDRAERNARVQEEFETADAARTNELHALRTQFGLRPRETFQKRREYRDYLLDAVRSETITPGQAGLLLGLSPAFVEDLMHGAPRSLILEEAADIEDEKRRYFQATRTGN